MTSDVARVEKLDPIMERLEDQIGWYDRKSLTNQKYYKRIKMVEIVAAAIIPLLSASAASHPRVMWVTGGLGVV